MRPAIKDAYKTSDSLTKKKVPTTGYSPAIQSGKIISQQQQSNMMNSSQLKTPLSNLMSKKISQNDIFQQTSSQQQHQQQLQQQQNQQQYQPIVMNKHQKSNSVNPPTQSFSQQQSSLFSQQLQAERNYSQKPQSQHAHGPKGSFDASYSKYIKIPSTQNTSKTAFSQPQSPKSKKRDEDLLLLEQQLKQSNLIPSSQNYFNHHQNHFQQPVQQLIQPQQSLSSQHSQPSQSNSTNDRSKPANILSYIISKDPSVSRNRSKQPENNKQPPQKEEEDQNQISMKNMFNYLCVIGKGGFGKVWKVEHKKSRQFFALKEMSKALIITKKSVPSVMNERNLLSILKHPFLVNMFYAYQDRDNLYLIMDLMPGGDLRYHIGRQRRFTEEQTRFFVCCIFLGLEYLHNNNIIHRDIKPENLVLDQQGYVRITDLGIARVWKSDNANDTSGTPGYMAPEVMCRQPHTFAVDYFALGVLAYEFMLGRRPYLGRSRKEIRDTILAKRVQIKKSEIPPGWSLEAADFINRMIERKPLNRLGINGPAEVRNHPWIKNFPWTKLERKELPAPFVPSKSDNFDAKQQITQEDEQNAEIIAQNALLLKTNSLQSLFNGYNYDGSQQLFSELNRQTPSTQSSSGRMGFNHQNISNQNRFD